MDELFAQLSLVSAILGGFAFTFVGALLSHPVSSRVYAWVFGASLLAAMAFMVTALGSVLVSLAVKNSYRSTSRRFTKRFRWPFCSGFSVSSLRPVRAVG